MPRRSKFYLYQRQVTNGKYWYVNFIHPETGVKMPGRSIDVLKEKMSLGYTESVKTKTEAIIIANKALEEGIIFDKGASVNFIDFCRRFWDFDNSEYIKMRNYIKPNSLGKEYCVNMMICFNRHVVPYLPSQIKIHDVTTRHLDSVVKKLLFEKKLATGTIQGIILSFSLPLKEAYRQGLIKINPADRLMKIPNNEKARGFLSYDESVEFSKTATQMFRDGKLRKSYYLALITAISTGMRSGEIRALRRENIVSNVLIRDDGVILDKIIIKESIAPYSGVKCTKGKYDREICIPHELGEQLIANSNSKGIVFPSIHKGYITSPTLREIFSKVLLEMGISMAEQRKRSLTFHSLRHGFATFSRDSNIPIEDRMLVLGHKSERVNERYTHITDQQLERVSQVTSNIVDLFQEPEIFYH